MTLTREDVLAAARLARLSLSDDEIDRTAEELTAILTQLDVLHPVDGSDDGSAHAAAHPSSPSPDAAVAETGASHDAPVAPTLPRADVPGADRMNVPPSYLAPEWRDGFFAVPRLPTHDSTE